MTTDFRALCKDLADELDAETGYTRSDGERITHADVSRARAALAEPVVEGPTDEELLHMAAEALGYERISPGRIYGAAEAYGDELLAFARAVLARWGHQPAPPAAGEVQA